MNINQEGPEEIDRNALRVSCKGIGKKQKEDKVLLLNPLTSTHTIGRSTFLPPFGAYHAGLVAKGFPSALLTVDDRKKNFCQST